MLSGQSFWPLYAWKVLYSPGHYITKVLGFLTGISKRVLLLFQAWSYDFIFLHREALPLGPPVFEWLLAKVLKKRLIYDFDDAIWIENTTSSNRWARYLKNSGKVPLICNWSYRISAGNSYLARYAMKHNTRVTINPTTIDTERLHDPELYPKAHHENEVIIGWTGTHSTLKYIQSLNHVLKEILQKYPQCRLRIIADKAPEMDTSYEFVPWCKESEIPDLIEIDIGLMPLPDDEWAQGKCGFKLLQFMALGTPVLCSPVGVNKEITMQNINGLLCQDEKEWLNHLDMLISQKDFRLRLGKKGREKVVSQYSVVSNSENFLSLFS